MTTANAKKTGSKFKTREPAAPKTETPPLIVRMLAPLAPEPVAVSLPEPPPTPPAVLTREFFTAGRAVFTVELPAAFITARAEQGETWHTHYTFGVRRSEWNGREYLLVDSFTAYEKPVYLGKLREDTGDVNLTTGSKFPADATRVKVVTKVIKAVWEGRGEDIAKAGWRVMHDGRCSKCRRSLTDPLSLDRGIGPDCYVMVCGSPEEFVRF